MKKQRLSLVNLAISSGYIFSQEITRLVLVSNGGNLSNSSAQLSFTLGNRYQEHVPLHHVI